MFRHILFPTDTSEMSNSAFDAAVDLMRKYDGRITLLNVHEEFMNKKEMQYLRVSSQQYREYIKEHALRSREVLETMIADAGVGDKCEVLLREGNPRKEILEIAAEIDAEIIVMASNGRSNLRQQIIGSVAEHVVAHSSIPVLVVKVNRG